DQQRSAQIATQRTDYLLTMIETRWKGIIMTGFRVGLIIGIGVAVLSELVLLAQQPAAAPVAQVRGNEGAGSTIFGNTCENCHGKLDSAPPPAMLKKLTPEKIYETLTTGNMKNQAADLTDIQKRDIAEWVSGRKLGATESGDV